MSKSIEKRLGELDWESVCQSLWSYGYALTAPLLTAEECGELIEMYSREGVFRSHIVMERYRLVRGDYKYFDYPLPAAVQDLRTHSYPHLSRLANQWNRAMGLASIFPTEHEAFLAQCRPAGQTRATPLLLHYAAGDFNCLHQDLYGEIAFPLQLTCFLSQPEIDYTGGEFLLLEQ